MRKDLASDLDSFRAYFDPQAEHFARLVLDAAGGKTKTLKTLGGSFSFRTVPGGLRVIDKDAALQWAKEHAPALVEVKTVESLPAAALKSHLQTTGEVPAGCEIADDRESFSHKI
jgi:phage host-nuclease inhibitor protein Gam